MALRRCIIAALPHRADKLARALAWLQRPRAPCWLSAIALALLATGFANGFVLDDHVLRALAHSDSNIAGLHPNPLFLFSFTSGRPEDNRALMDQGALMPWYGDEHHLNAFFRPLSSLSHVLDFALFGDRAWPMHLHSLLWFALLLWVVFRLFQRLASGGTGPGVAALAFALFAIDSGHGMTVGWIANRNALIAAALALPALLFHHDHATRGSASGAVLGPLCFGFGLCAGETALAVFGYLLAYSIVLERAPWWRRLLRLAPYLALLAMLRATYGWLGLGSAGSASYHDPGREPLGYLLALFEHAPVLLATQLGLPLADFWFWGPPWLELPIWLCSVATVGGLALVGHVLLADDERARFWTLGMLLSALAVSASIPGTRLLLVPSIGAAVFVAKLIARLLPAVLDNQSIVGPKRLGPFAIQLALPARAAEPLLGTLVLLHLLAQPFGIPITAGAFAPLRTAIERVDAGIPARPAIAAQTAIIVNAPFDVMVSYLQVMRAVRGVPRPAHLYWLAIGSSELGLETRDAHCLRVQPALGFMRTPLERHYRADPRALGDGTRVELSEMSVRVRGVTRDGRPAAAEFCFRDTLSSARYRFLVYRDRRLLPFALPAAGQRVRLPAENFFGTLLAELHERVFGQTRGVLARYLLGSASGMLDARDERTPR